MNVTRRCVCDEDVCVCGERRRCVCDEDVCVCGERRRESARKCVRTRARTARHHECVRAYEITHGAGCIELHEPRVIRLTLESATELRMQGAVLLECG